MVNIIFTKYIVFVHPKAGFYYCFFSFPISSYACLLAALSFENIPGFYQVMIEKTPGMRQRGRVLLSSPITYMSVFCFCIKLFVVCADKIKIGSAVATWGTDEWEKVAPLIIPVTPVLSIFSQYRELSHSF